MHEIMDFVSSVGFPIVIALFVIIRLEKIIRENTCAVKENNALIRELRILIESINHRK